MIASAGQRNRLREARAARAAAATAATTALAASAAATLLGVAALVAVPGVALGSHEADLTAVLQLPEGDIELSLETGALQVFDEEDAPFAVLVMDGCSINDHFWVLGVGLGSAAAPLAIFDERSGLSHRLVLPAFRPGEPAGAVFDPEALAICREGPSGGIPPVGGTATYTPVTPDCPDETAGVVLLSDGRDDAFRTFERERTTTDDIISDLPIATIDESSARDDLQLFAEGRTPRHVEGVRFSGDEGMLPGRAALAKALEGITKARVRRAFEAAKSQTVPRPLMADLGLRDVDCVYHVSLTFDTLGADAYLAQAGWISEGGAPLAPPELVPDRFVVDLVRADGTSTRLPLIGPFEGSAGAGQSWEYGTEEAMVGIIDGCALSGSLWATAAAVTDEPLELSVSDPSTGASASFVLWTDRQETSRMVDTGSLAGCT
jgi:hypothetical protein